MTAAGKSAVPRASNVVPAVRRTFTRPASLARIDNLVVNGVGITSRTRGLDVSATAGAGAVIVGAVIVGAGAAWGSVTMTFPAMPETVALAPEPEVDPWIMQ